MKDTRPDDGVLRCRVCHNPIPPPDYRTTCGQRCDALDTVIDAAHQVLDDAHGSLKGPVLFRALRRLEKTLVKAGEREPLVKRRSPQAIPQGNEAKEK